MKIARKEMEAMKRCLDIANSQVMRFSKMATQAQGRGETARLDHLADGAKAVEMEIQREIERLERS